jgi:methionyl-tRNA formyltransferase
MIPQKKRLLIACGGGTALEPIEVQVEGRKRMSAEAFLNGHQVRGGEMLGAKAA